MTTTNEVRLFANSKRPCLFLFDGGAEGVKQPALSTFTGALLDAISTADPSGMIAAELRGGLPGLAEFAARISEVHSAPGRSGRTLTHDMALFRLLLWDMADALSEGRGAPDSLAILEILRQGQEECLALSDVPEDIQEGCDAVLRGCYGYIGACPIDPGNPVQRRAFYDGLLQLALISDGAVIQQRSIEGEEDLPLAGARHFKPNGLRWVDYSYEETPEPFRLEEASVSARGAVSLDRLRRKTHITVEGRVFQALSDASWTDLVGQTYRFAAAEPGEDILQAILPRWKVHGLSI